MNDWLIVALVSLPPIVIGILGYLRGLAAGYQRGYRDACRNLGDAARIDPGEMLR